MRKFLKYFGITIGVIILLVVIAAVILLFVVDPNDYRDDISHYVKNKTGRTLTIQGDISLSIFPWLGAKVGQSRLSNAPGFGDEPFARIQGIDVNVRLWPLLHGVVKAGKVTIDGLRLNLERNAAGKNNWHDLTALNQTASGTSGPQPSPPGKSGGGAAFALQGLEITKSAITWTDEQVHRQYRLSNINLDMGEFVSGKTFPLNLGFDLKGTNPALTGHGTFQGKANLDLAHKVYSLNNAKVTLRANGQTIPGGNLNARLAWQHASANLNTGAAALEHLSLKALGLGIQADLTGRELSANPHIAGVVKLADFSPRKVLARLGKDNLLNTADPTVLKHANGSFKLAASSNSAALENLKLTLDASHITGVFRVPDIKQQKLAFNLKLDKLNADRYLPKAAGEAPPTVAGAAEKPAATKPSTPPGKAGTAPGTAGSKAAAARSIDHVKLPVERIRKLNIDGKLHVGTLKAFQLTTTDATVTITAHDGVLQVHPLRAKLYGGSYDANVKVDARGDTPKLSTEETVSQVHFGGLAQDLFKAQRLTGTGNMKIALKGQGKTVGEIRSALNGQLNFALKNGAIEGVDIWAAIRRGYALIKGRSAPASKSPARTKFAELGGTATVDNGVLHNNDLLAKLPFLRVTGAGSIDLVQTLINYHIKANVVKTPDFGQNEKLDQLTGVIIPLKIGGTLSNMNVQPDLAAALKGEVKQKFKKKLENKLQDLLHLNKKHKPPGHEKKPSGPAVSR